MPEERSYIAFISYRHKTLDTKVAKMIQRRIESYCVPKELRKQVGSSKLGYVFRDEDELPLSASLSDSIVEALDHSQFLIVVCTPDLPLSKWCEQEINYFLQTHDRDHLLAVLADGSQDESFSPLMLHTFDENGNILSNLEPLAANIVGSNHHISRKRYRKESLRLIACLIGCPFDTLYQREKRARTVRLMSIMVIIFASLSAFGCYAAIKAQQIAQREKQIAEQTQIIVQEQKEKISSQAELLAVQAQEAYSQKDCSKAVNLALLSMELSDENIEQQSRLKSLLVSCLNLYSRPDEASIVAVPIGSIISPAGTEIEEFFLNSDGSRLFTIAGNCFSVWDTSDCSLISAYEQDDGIRLKHDYGNESYLFEKQHQYIIWNEKSIVCYEYETGKAVWTKIFDKPENKARNVLPSPEENLIYSIRYSMEQQAALIEKIDVKTGDVIKKYSFPGNYSHAFEYACDISPDNRYIACSGNNGSMVLTLYIFDLEQGTVTEAELDPIDPWGSPVTEKIMFTDDRRMLVSIYDGSVNIRRNIDYDHYIDKVGQKKFVLWCYDYLNREIVWKYDTAGNYGKDGLLLDYRDLQIPSIICTEVSGIKTIVVALGTTVLMLNEETGICMEEMLLNSNIATLYQQDSFINMILENGNREIISAQFQPEDVLSVKNFPAGILQANISIENFYIKNKSDSIIKYVLGKYDENYTEVILSDESLQNLINQISPDDRTIESGNIRIELGSENDRFRILSDKTYEVITGDEIKVISINPEGNRIFVGLKKQIMLFDIDSNLLFKTDISNSIYSSKDDIYIFFPEETVCFYGDQNGGYLIDMNPNSMEVIKYIKYCLGFDHAENRFIICDYNYFSKQESNLRVGFLKYYSTEEIKTLAAGIHISSGVAF